MKNKREEQQQKNNLLALIKAVFLLAHLLACEQVSIRIIFVRKNYVIKYITNSICYRNSQTNRSQNFYNSMKLDILQRCCVKCVKKKDTHANI